MTYRSALVIDGSRNARLRAVTLLRLAGFRVDEATGVGSGLAQAAHHPPTLVVVDPVLPDGDGIELLRELRRGGSWAEFLVATNQPTAELRTRAFQAGATACVAKPLEAADLITFLRGRTTGPATRGVTAEWVLQQHALHIDSVRADRRPLRGARRAAQLRDTYAIPLPKRSSPVGGDHLRRAAVHDDRT